MSGAVLGFCVRGRDVGGSCPAP